MDGIIEDFGEETWMMSTAQRMKWNKLSKALFSSAIIIGTGYMRGALQD